MPTRYEAVQSDLRRSPAKWLVTGAAGFIGSHLVEALLKLEQQVRGLDNLSTGFEKNLPSAEQSKHFEFVRGDIRDEETCGGACAGVDYVLHHAALGSVPSSLEDPLATHAINVTGFANILNAAREQRVKRVIYASSSAVYGDEPTLPKVESRIGNALSPYALSKHANELYAANFRQCFALESIGLRYFNVFGARQDPRGPYAAVIPKWIEAMIDGEPVFINGDGETTRDFCHVSDVVQANLLAATVGQAEAVNQVYNIAVGQGTTLNDLFSALRDELRTHWPQLKQLAPQYRDFRPGDIRHSQADITRAKTLLGYAPEVGLKEGLAAAMPWYIQCLKKTKR
jgi:UDP-N-acetylglucosamine/UDP-N-acetylgalactosamine 4-epimerase